MLRELRSDDPRQHAADDVQMLIASASVGQQRRDSPTNDDYLATGVVVPRRSVQSVPL